MSKKKKPDTSAERRGHYVTCIELNAKGLKKLREAEKQIESAISVEFMDEAKFQTLMRFFGVTEEDFMI